MLQWKFCRTATTTKRLILRAHIHGIVSHRPVSNENKRELRKLVDTMVEHRLSLRNRGQPVEHQDLFFVYLIAKILPSETRKFWELSLKGKELLTYQELKTLLEERVQALESAAPSNSSSNTKKWSHSQQNQAQRQLNTHVLATNQQCGCCE